MDEMNNMNETTVMENENSVEVVPEENIQMIENEETSGINPKKIHLRAPWTITEETVPEKTEDADKEAVEEPSDEEE